MADGTDPHQNPAEATTKADTLSLDDGRSEERSRHMRPFAAMKSQAVSSTTMGRHYLWCSHFMSEPMLCCISSLSSAQQEDRILNPEQALDIEPAPKNRQ